MASRSRLHFTLILAAGYMVAEIVGGWLSNSLVLLADAGHMFSDVASLALSSFALWLAVRPADGQRTFGYLRAEIIAAFINASTLVVVAGFIVVEAWERSLSPPEVHGGLMMGIAIGGLLVNIAGLLILHGGRHDSLNLRGAWLHVLSDALGSVAAIVAGILIQLYGWLWVDPAISSLIALLVLLSAWRLLKDSVWVLMEGAPSGVDVSRVHAAVADLPGVSEVHDLHVWTIASGVDSLSCHVVSDGSLSHSDLLRSVQTAIHKESGIDHTTIQIESETVPEQPQLTAATGSP